MSIKAHFQKLANLDSSAEREVLHFYQDQKWSFSAEERGIIPGAAPTPVHPTSRRIVYAATGVLIGLTGGLGNAVVSANLPYLQGSLGLDLTEIAWLPTVYLVTSAITGCLLVKYRQQFGVRSFCLIFLTLQVAFILGHLFVNGLGSAIAVRAAGGIVGSALTTLGTLYMVQALPKAHRQRALVIGIGLPQLALPLARLFPIDTLAIDNWKGPYLFELGLSLVTLAVVMFVRLPSNVRSKSFERLDLVSFPLYASSITLLGSALGLGSYLWWTNRAWIGYCLAAAVPLAMAALTIESFRARPLIDVRWLSGMTLVRFALVAVLARIVLSEQAIGAIGLLRDVGLTNDDIRPLSWLVFGAAVLGLLVSAAAVGPTRLTPLVMLAVAFVAIGAYFDSSVSTLSRAAQLYYTQTLIAFATTLFIGPSFVFGLSKVISEGGTKMTTFVALFGMTQSIGALLGTSIIQTYLTYAQQYHFTDLAGQLNKDNPVVTASANAIANQYSGTILDHMKDAAEGIAALNGQVMLDARVAAYDDVFFLIAALATFTTCFLAAVLGQAYWARATQVE